MASMAPSAWRRLWEPPAAIKAARSGDRRIAFLELFFDLVFVVLVAQLAHHLADHPSWSAFAWFAFLFFIVWSSWLNGSFYHDAHGTNDLSIRVFTFAQMLALAAMGAFVGQVPGSGDVGFAAAYAANSVVLAVMWFRTGLHDPPHRAGAYPYAAAFLVGAALFVASTFASGPVVYVLWAAAVAIQASAAVPAIRILRVEFGSIYATPSLIERFGQIVMIVLGEVVAGSIIGMANREPTSLHVVAIGLLGVLIAVALWWLYFDLVSEHMHQRGKGLWWLYLHYPLIIGIAGVGAAVLAAVERVGEPDSASVRWLTVGTTALALVCIAALAHMVDGRPSQVRANRNAQVAVVGSALAILGVGLIPADSGATITLVLLVLLVPITFSAVVWLGQEQEAS